MGTKSYVKTVRSVNADTFGVSINASQSGSRPTVHLQKLYGFQTTPQKNMRE
jgi:hypothetical protein